MRTLAARPLFVWALSAGAAVLSLLCGTSPGAAGRETAVQTVDILVPFAPATVRIGDRTHVVYELHVTNFLRAGVSIQAVQVMTAESGGLIADHRGADLLKRLGRPGLPGSHADPQVLGPGMRALVFLWIPLDESVPRPRSLRHRFLLEVLEEAGPRRVTVDTAPVSVSETEPLVLSPPLRGGPWAAVYDPWLRGGHRTSIYTLDGRARIPGRFAIDWIRPTAERVIAGVDGARRPDWNGRGSDVLAVADSVVAAARDDIPDNDLSGPAGPIALESASGNYVALDLGKGRFAVYEHLEHGSIAVKRGDRVLIGQTIARLGNSGRSSIGPHLHFHVGDSSSPLSAEGLPFVFAGFERIGAFASIEAVTGGRPWMADAEPPARRRLERPDPNAVVVFP